MAKKITKKIADDQYETIGYLLSEQEYNTLNSKLESTYDVEITGDFVFMSTYENTFNVASGMVPFTGGIVIDHSPKFSSGITKALYIGFADDADTPLVAFFDKETGDVSDNELWCFNDITKVVGNPSGNGTDTLSKIQIGNKVYNVPSGGSNPVLATITSVYLDSSRYIYLTNVSDDWLMYLDNNLFMPLYVSLSSESSCSPSDVLRKYNITCLYLTLNPNNTCAGTTEGTFIGVGSTASMIYGRWQSAGAGITLTDCFKMVGQIA